MVHTIDAQGCCPNLAALKTRWRRQTRRGLAIHAPGWGGAWLLRDLPVDGLASVGGGLHPNRSTPNSEVDLLRTASAPMFGVRTSERATRWPGPAVRVRASQRDTEVARRARFVAGRPSLLVPLAGGQAR
eukprot:scaffold249_cov405-Prasinococcus_capsulatus_cf.AAC.4